MLTCALQFYQKWQKKQDQKKQQQHAQAAQQQSHAGTPYPQQQSYPQQQQQPWGQQGPYPQQQPSTQYPQSSGPYGGYQASAPSTGISSHQEYEAMRNEANRHGDMMSQCFSQSQQAYDADDHGRAKELSNEGKHHQQQMEELNERCSAWIYHGALICGAASMVTHEALQKTTSLSPMALSTCTVFTYKRRSSTQRRLSRYATTLTSALLPG